MRKRMTRSVPTFCFSLHLEQAVSKASGRTPGIDAELAVGVTTAKIFNHQKYFEVLTFQFGAVRSALSLIQQAVDVVVEETFALEDFVQVDIVVLCGVLFRVAGQPAGCGADNDGDGENQKSLHYSEFADDLITSSDSPSVYIANPHQSLALICLIFPKVVPPLLSSRTTQSCIAFREG